MITIKIYKNKKYNPTAFYEKYVVVDKNITEIKKSQKFFEMMRNPPNGFAKLQKFCRNTLRNKIVVDGARRKKTILRLKLLCRNILSTNFMQISPKFPKISRKCPIWEIPEKFCQNFRNFGKKKFRNFRNFRKSVFFQKIKNVKTKIRSETSQSKKFTKIFVINFVGISSYFRHKFRRKSTKFCSVFLELQP